jgi:hypothetical protein
MSKIKPFKDITNEKNVIHTALTMEELKEEGSEDFSVQTLRGLAILFCEGSNDEKAKEFYKMVQISMQEKISADDKDFDICFGKMMKLSTIYLMNLYAKVTKESVDVPSEDIEKWANV